MILVIVSIYQHCTSTIHTITVGHTFVDSIESATELSFVITSIFLPIIRSKNWKLFIDLMENLEQEHINNMEEGTNMFKVLFTYLSILLLILFDISWFIMSNNEYYLMLAMNKLYYSAMVYFVYTINKIINQVQIIIIKGLNDIKDENGEDTIEQMKRNYLTLYQLTTQFNRIFGLPIFFQMLTTVIIVINIVNDTLYLRLNESTIWKPQLFCDLVSGPVFMVSRINFFYMKLLLGPYSLKWK